MELRRALLAFTTAVGLIAVPVGARQSTLGVPSAAAALGAPPQDSVFRTGTRTVPVFASVTDDVGRFVLDLRRDEFEVRDDGKVQPLSLFTTDVQPLTAVVLLDGSRSMVNGLETVITAADHFVVRLMPGDRALVGSFSDEIRFARGFTGDRDELARQVNDLFDLRIGPGTSLWDAIGQATAAFQGRGEHRRVIVVFTDGDDTSSSATYSDALAAARRANAMVYAVLIRGIERLSEDRGGRRSRPQDLVSLTAATGGGYFAVNHVLDDMNSISTQIAEELHNQYVLGFVPESLDGKMHKLEVRIKRPRLKVRARESYLADADEAGAWQ